MLDTSVKMPGSAPDFWNFLEILMRDERLRCDGAPVGYVWRKSQIGSFC